MPPGWCPACCGGSVSEPQGVRYERAPEGYFERRGLRRYAGVGSLWALGVGAVISGDFFGWNFGIAAGGFGGLLIATVIITLLYVGLCFSVAEMTAALPHTGGAYSFARSSMGPWGAYVTGLAENMEYILTPAVIVVAIGSYLGAVFETPEAWAPAWWLGAYVVFVGLNIVGVEASFRFTVFITLLALAILGVFWIGALAHFDLAHFAFDIAPDAGGSAFLPRGWKGVLAALPFAIWFYLAIEQLPLAAEEAHTPQRDLPRGILLGLATLVLCAFLTLILSTGMAPGAAALGVSEAPLFEGFRTIFGAGLGARLLALVAVAGLVASFHTIIFAYGRQIYSLSRAGYFPRWLSLTHGTRQTPHVALVAGAAIGYVVALTVHGLGSDHPVGAVLLNMAVFGAVISYGLQMASFVLLRRKRPEIERPYRSPLGVPGALVALGISALTLAALFYVDDVYRNVVFGALVWFALGLLWFAGVGRHRLVYSPEEAFALRVSGD
ncbi:MAG: ethanolamine permease [Deltaproteobacteria bacterium]|nr:ethanolamine permease [Deltaproteobacteria bacterium]MBW2359681.1 ethanolamine permease [Deltaproteobacteria bacterium]